MKILNTERSRRGLHRQLSVPLTLLFVFTMGSAANAQTNEELLKMIEGLRDVVEAQQQQIETLLDRAKANHPNSHHTEAKDPVPPKVVRSRKDNITLTINGHVNRSLLLADDGEHTDLFHVDNDTEPTLVNFVGEGRVNDDLTVGARVEAQFASNPSNGVSQNTEGAAVGAGNFTERHLEVYFASKRFGTLFVGQGNTASEGIAEIDLSGTNIVTRSNFGTFGGGLIFRDSGTGELSGVTIGNAFDPFDGFGRDDRVRYDTPVFAGFQLSTSALQGDATDVALRYSGEFHGAKVAAGIAYSNFAPISRVIDDQWSGSGSVILANGLNLTLAGGTRELEDGSQGDPHYFYSKLGYRASYFDIGKTSFSVEGAWQDDLSGDGDDASLYGFGLSQRLDRYGTELYAGFRVYELDRNGANFDDIPAGMLGAFVQF